MMIGTRYTQPIVIVGTCLAAIISVEACSDDLVVRPSLNRADNVLWNVQASPLGMTMAVDEQQHVSVKLLNILGDPITPTDSIPLEFVSEDPGRVLVDSLGNITAVRSTPFNTRTGPTPVRVTVTARSGLVTKADTVYVVVTDTAPTHPITSVSIQPPAYPADSTWRARLRTMTVPVTATTTDGSVVPIAYAFIHTDRRRQGLSDIIVPRTRVLTFPQVLGRFWVFASGLLYGVPVQDSVEYISTDVTALTVVFTAINVANSVTESGIRMTYDLPPCGLLAFGNNLTVPITITFEQPEATSGCPPLPGIAGEGNIVALAPKQTMVRRIPTPGTYKWTATKADGSTFPVPVHGSVRIRAIDDY